MIFVLNILLVLCLFFFFFKKKKGYAAGYLLATLVNYAVQITNSTWRIMFWAGSVFALLAVAIRFVVPESEAFEKTQEARKLMSRSFFKDIWIMIKSHYLRVIYMVILMAFFNVKIFFIIIEKRIRKYIFYWFKN